SAAELAADARRYLADEPITARPASARYQLAKFATRNKGLVAAAAGILLVLVLGVIATSYEAVRANRQARRASQAEHVAQDRLKEVEAANANTKAINEFALMDLLG